MIIDNIGAFISSKLDAKLLCEDRENWIKCLKSMDHSLFVPLQYKPSFIEYQRDYNKDIFEEYQDISMVLYRGGIAVGIWPLCIFCDNGVYRFGSLGMPVMQPLFAFLKKADAQRRVIQNILHALCSCMLESGLEFESSISSQIAVMEKGTGQWQRKWMEEGARCVKTSWWTYVDLGLSNEEIQSRIRRTNKYSIAKGEDDYNIEIYDSDNGRNLDDVFAEFHRLHRNVSGRETRSQLTWDRQKEAVRENNDDVGWDFVVFIRDKRTGVLAGCALFCTTPQTGLYSVAAYDRERFSKPVGHIVQAAAMDYMRKKGIRWYEIGERVYPGDENSNLKLCNIGNYKEGFATHFYPKIVMKMDVCDR